MTQFHDVAAAFVGMKPIEKGDLIWSKDPNSVGKTTQVATMYFVSLHQYSEFSIGNLFTDMQMTASEGNNKYGPVLSHEIRPAPPHQYIGWTTVAST